jgi:arylsulfatase A-like enzyme
LDETAIIVSADHAEAFGELGQYMDHGTASPAVTRVPFVVRWPGLTDGAAGSVNDDLLSNLDLAPTLAEALGLAVPEGWCGQSLLPQLRGEAPAHRRAEIVWTHGLHTRQRAVFDGRFLYIRSYHPSLYHYPPRMLFDLETDPNQTLDLAEAQPAEVERLDGVLRAWEREQVTATGMSDPLRDVQSHHPSMLAAFDDYLDRLRAAGRDADADRLLARVERLVEDYAPSALAP